MKGYCVFWIPSIYHVAPVPLSENTFLEKEDISDEVGCQCHLSLKLDSQENIIVILSLRGIDVEFSLMHKGANDKSHPNDPWMLNNRAYVNARANNVEEAEKDMEKLEHITTPLTKSMAICKEATKGLIAYRKKDKETGRKLYEHAILHASELKEDSDEVVLKAKINMLREELMISNFQNTQVLRDLEKLSVPDQKQDLLLLKNEVFEEMKKYVK